MRFARNPKATTHLVVFNERQRHKKAVAAVNDGTEEEEGAATVGEWRLNLHRNMKMTATNAARLASYCHDVNSSTSAHVGSSDSGPIEQRHEVGPCPWPW